VTRPRSKTTTQKSRTAGARPDYGPETVP
jgi:hypothetical protein